MTKYMISTLVIGIKSKSKKTSIIAGKIIKIQYNNKQKENM